MQLIKIFFIIILHTKKSFELPTIEENGQTYIISDPDTLNKEKNNPTLKFDETIQYDFMQVNQEFLEQGDIFNDQFSRKVSLLHGFWYYGKVKYRMDPSLAPETVHKIIEAMNIWERDTCIRFINVTGNPTFNVSKHFSVYFTNEKPGCFSALGRVSRFPQMINIQEPGCAHVNIISHEIAHTVGLDHEQCRTGRNQHIRVEYDRILEGKVHNFEESSTLNLGIEYDYRSIMHYNSFGFGKSLLFENTIHTLDPRLQYIIGMSSGLSFKDLKAINELYCTDRYAKMCKLDTTSVCNSGYLQENCTCKCPNGITGKSCDIGEEINEYPCGQRITESGTFATPLFPQRDPKDFKNRNCVWIIQSPNPNMTVNVHFNEFSFAKRAINKRTNSSTCYPEFVELRLAGSNVDGTFYCNDELMNSTVQSIGPEMVVLINSLKLTYNTIGLNFTVSFGTPKNLFECGQVNETIVINTGQSVEITSPGFGSSNYPNNFKCMLNIETKKPNDKLQVIIVDMEVESTKYCCIDKVTLEDAKSKKLLLETCGKKKHEKHFYLENQVNFQFKSNADINGSGFKVRFVALAEVDLPVL